MKLLDLFSGIGGFHLGFKQAGYNFSWTGFSEIDKYAKETYQRHFPRSEDLGDIRAINLMAIPKKLDIITFGFPCQDLSVAGKRQGFSGERSSLFFEAVRIIQHTKPSYFIFENVKGIFSTNQGRDFEEVLQAITAIGYDGEWQCINTSWFLPQNRERIYFVGFPRGTSRPQIFPIGSISQLPKKENPGKQKGTECLSSTLCSGYGKTRPSGTYVKTKPIGFKPVYKSKTQGYRVYDPSGISITLSGNGGGVGAKTGLYMLTEKRTEQAKELRRKMRLKGKDWSPRREKELVPREDGLSNCITATQSNEQFLSDGVKIRKLTPTECERLQGFPEGWTEGISDTQRYRCLGNAVSVPVVKIIAERLKNHIQKKR